MTIVRLLGVASLADGVWQFVDRSGWRRFWGKSLRKARKRTATANAIAAGELLLGAWLVLRARGRGRGGNAAKFPAYTEHHPITAT
jgi:hypothetical protein